MAHDKKFLLPDNKKFYEETIKPLIIDKLNSLVLDEAVLLVAGKKLVGIDHEYGGYYEIEEYWIDFNALTPAIKFLEQRIEKYSNEEYIKNHLEWKKTALYERLIEDEGFSIIKQCK